MPESKFLPLPPSVLPLPEGPEGYRLQRAGERGYVVISGFTQAAFVVTAEGVILVDAPPIGQRCSRAHSGRPARKAAIVPAASTKVVLKQTLIAICSAPSVSVCVRMSPDARSMNCGSSDR